MFVSTGKPKILRIPQSIVSLKWVLLMGTLVLSCLNNILLIVWTIALALILPLLYKKEGAIEAFIYIQLRSLLNPGIAVSYTDTASVVKWAVIFLLSFYLLFFTRNSTKNLEVQRISLLLALFAMIVIVSIWFVSSYPLVASFKVMSWIIPFTAIIKGISATKGTDWIKMITFPLGLICFGSIILIGSSIGYLRTGYAFQGLFNHPNVYGTILAVFISGYLYKCKHLSLLNIAVIGYTIFLAIQSGSRTGMLSIVLVVLIYMLTLKTKLHLKIFLIVITCGAVVLLLVSDNSVITFITDFMYKGNKSNLLYSRENQIQRNIDRFLASPLFGTGFNVPFTPGLRSTQFSFDVVTENGNLILALLGDVGIIGLILFIVAYTYIYRLGKGVVSTIFFIPFIASMGEMSFFSTNNFAIVFYMYLAVYVCDGVNRLSK